VNDEREEAKRHLKTMIITALSNSYAEATTKPANSWQIMADAILDQITQPQSGWALKELSKPAAYQDAAPKRNSNEPSQIPRE
jgi:hypothetical protein